MCQPARLAGESAWPDLGMGSRCPHPDAIMSPMKCRLIFERLRSANPAPRTELVYGSTFELLVAVILSAQATDRAVNKATACLFQRANTPGALLELGEQGIKDYIRTLGLFNAKAANIIRTCGILVEQHGGEVPRGRAALEALPGVGRKTANVILNIAFGEPTLGVDTHILRLANRSGLATGKSPLEVERGLMGVIPPEFLQDAHHWLILHGRYVCVARQPRCGNCIIREMCDFSPKTQLS